MANLLVSVRAYDSDDGQQLLQKTLITNRLLIDDWLFNAQQQIFHAYL
jgi:hypothetical protein